MTAPITGDETGAAGVAGVPSAAAAPSMAIDLASAMQRMGGDQTLFAEVSRLFIEDCPVRLAAIRAAVDDGDAGRIRETAHALKGAAGSLSATGLYEATASLERLAAEGQLPATRAAWAHVESEAAAAVQALRNFESREITP